MIIHEGTAPIDLSDRRSWWLRLWWRLFPRQYLFEMAPSMCGCGHDHRDHDDPWSPNLPDEPPYFRCHADGCDCKDYDTGWRK